MRAGGKWPCVSVTRQLARCLLYNKRLGARAPSRLPCSRVLSESLRVLALGYGESESTTHLRVEMTLTLTLTPPSGLVLHQGCVSRRSERRRPSTGEPGLCSLSRAATQDFQVTSASRVAAQDPMSSFFLQ